MFSGESISVDIKTTPSYMTVLFDWFGTDFKLLKKSDESITVRIKCNYEAMRCWTLQYGPYVEVLAPEKLRKELLEAAKGMVKKYSVSSD